MQIVLEPSGPDAPISGTVAFLEPSGERHQGVERRVEIGPVTLDSLLAHGGVTKRFAFDAVHGRARMAATALADGLVRIAMCVHNMTAVEPGLDREGAMHSSLLSTHLVAHAPGSRFASPFSPGPTAKAAVAACDQINIFPVLATDTDDTVLGATIVLPDHPQIAPESHGDLFDATEIEEALLLHVMALSDGEREQVAGGDPALREMVERAAAATPEDLVRLHGRTVVSDPGGPERRPR
jgi:hypothetical protein